MTVHTFTPPARVPIDDQISAVRSLVEAYDVARSTGALRTDEAERLKHLEAALATLRSVRVRGIAPLPPATEHHGPTDAEMRAAEIRHGVG